MDSFYVNNCTLIKGSDKLEVSSYSLTNDQITTAIKVLAAEAKYRGLKVPELEPKPEAPPDDKPALDDAEMALVESGRMIGAIKAYRSRHVGMGLRDAKDACDAYKAKWEDAGSPKGGIPKKTDDRW